MRTTELPKVASELIRLALCDLERAEASPLHKIDMDTWHTPEEEDVCAVCFAGAVLAFSLGEDPGDEVGPANYTGHTARALVALNDFRNGHPRSGLDVMAVTYERETVSRTRIVPRYLVDKDGFKHAMHSLANDLEGVGL